jgi:ABC-2 type transport system ATP-binding protein
MERILTRKVLIVAVVGPPEAAARLLEQSPLVEKVEIKDGRLLVTLAEKTTDYSELPTVLVTAGFKLTLFREEEINLETAFMALTKGLTA